MADMASTSAGALRALAMELKNIESQPLEGFTISASDDNLFVWTVGIYGPPNTLYQVVAKPTARSELRKALGSLFSHLTIFRADTSKL